MNLFLKFKYLCESIQHPMIDIDGVQKHRHNSLGQPIHHTDEGIKNFHNWFGDSKIVDEHGRPKVVYHGSYTDIKHFDPKLANSEGGAFYFSHSPLMKNPADNANTYAKRKRKSEDGNVIPVYLKSSNPLITGFDEDLPTDHTKVGDWLTRMDNFDKTLDRDKPRYFNKEIKKARQNGHDGVIFRNVRDVPNDVGANFANETDVHAVFHPHQIKSAIGNNGNYSDKYDSLAESISNKIQESNE